MNLIALAESGQIVRMEHWMHATDCSIGVNGLQYRMSSLPVLFVRRFLIPFSSNPRANFQGRTA